MSLLGLAWRGVKHRRLSSLLTIVSVALGVALVLFVVRARTSAQASYTSVARGYDLILGPTHGSPLQITLNTLFHIGEAGGTVPWDAYERIRDDERVARAIPYAVGDNFRGHHVVGTTRDLFTTLEDRRARSLGEGIRGRVFEQGSFEAVIGATIASRFEGMRIGGTFNVSHGIAEGGASHGERWTVVGILRPTGTPADRALYIPIETFYEIGDHQKEADRLREGRGDEEPGVPAPEDHGHGHAEASDQHIHGLSAIGVRLRVPYRRFEIRSEWQKERRNAQAVIPVEQVGEMLQIVHTVDGVLELVAWLVTVVAAMSILVGLYNTIAGRRREIAILRALGARPGHVFVVIVLESLVLCGLGALLGLFVGHLGLIAAAPVLLENYGVVLDSALGWLEMRILLVVLGLGFLAGLLPAWQGLQTPVAKNLQPVE